MTSKGWSQDNSRGEETSRKSIPQPYLKKEKATISKRKYKKTYAYKFNRHHDKLIEEFYERRKKLRKKYRRITRIMKKPQYSDFSYFGHKRKPKIREVGKRRFCDECGIVH